MKIRKATIKDIPSIQSMANIVFRKTYEEILSPEQMDYMIEWMYSTQSLKDQITGEDKEFFIAENEDGIPGGYISIEKESTLQDGRPLYHLQKIYVMPDNQCGGLGKQLFNYIIEHLSKRHPEGCRIELNVNRHNKAIGFYEHMGMHRDRQGDFPIGNGYYMNDYIYAMDIN